MGAAGEVLVTGGYWKVTLSSIVIFGFFWGVLAMVEVAQKLRFLNEYGDLETVDPGYCKEAFG